MSEKPKSSELYEKYKQLREQDPKITTRAAAQKIIDEMPVELRGEYNYELVASGFRMRDSRASKKNIFEETIEEKGFAENQDWGYGWVKTKGASVFIKNPKTPSLDGIRDAVIDAVNDAVSDVVKGIDWQGNSTGNPKSGNLFVPNIFDLHLGKLAWHEETGENYDVKIASQRFRNALEDLITKASGYNIEGILFPIGNDFFNSDKSTPFPQTTKGTPQTDDVRWQQMFRMGVQLMVEAVIRLGKIAPVHVKVVSGNHDTERAFYLGETISAVFRDNPHVEVDNSPMCRKYYQWGECMIGLAHGNNEKPQDLPLIMAQEAKEMWATTFYREWLLGHLHHKQKFITQEAKDYRGVRVTYLTSPSAADSWHYEKSFNGAIKGAEAFIYNKEEGFVGSVAHNIK